MGRAANKFIAKWLAGERVDRQRHGNLGQFRRQCTLLFRGMETQGLDMSQQCDPLIDSPCAMRALLVTGTRRSAKSAGGFFTLIWLVRASTCQNGKLIGFHVVVEANFQLPLLVQQKDLIGREPPHLLLREAIFHESAAGGA